MNYSWPGNVRQIKHFSESLILNCALQCSADTLDNLFNEISRIVEPELHPSKHLPLDATYNNDVFTDLSERGAFPSCEKNKYFKNVEGYSDLKIGDGNSERIGASENGGLNESFGKEGSRLTLPSFEAVRINAALQKAKYNRTRAAELLGIGRTTLWRKMKELNIK